MKSQRIRDPIHGLISFDSHNDFEKLIWDLINCREFQRLRRIKQLGFSDLVFPGATHSRFAHSIGVFHTARRLARILSRIHDGFQDDKAKIAICAALLHDIGHGPFSHSFEAAAKKLGRGKRHETWTADIISGDTEVGNCLESFSPEFRKSVSNLLREEYPADIYSSIVHSQFDADRLDYLRRDKYMTGTEHGGFDWEWLFENLAVSKLPIAPVEDDPTEVDPLGVDCLVLGAKGLKAAEGYLLGRLHLYSQVYFHKTTRAAEKVFQEIFYRIGDLVKQGDVCQTGLSHLDPVRRYFEGDPSDIPNYLKLDDFSVFGALHQIRDCSDKAASELAGRLLDRKLPKCFDVAGRFGSDRQAEIARFKQKFSSLGAGVGGNSLQLIEDRAPISAYSFNKFDSPGAREAVMIQRQDGSGFCDDLAEVSHVVKALAEEPIYRIYYFDSDGFEALNRIALEVK